MFAKSTDYFSLMIPPWPDYQTCNFRDFLQNEKHMTRQFAEFVMIFMLKNELYFTEDDREVTLSAGEWYVQLPGLRQEGKIPSPYSSYFYIHFKANGVPLPHCETADCSLSDIKNSGYLTLPTRGTYEQEELLPLFNLLKSYKNKSENALSEQSIFLTILEKVVSTVSAPKSKSATLAHKLQEYLIENYLKDTCIPNMQNFFSYSSDYLTKVFKHEYDTAPSQYIKKLRINMAKELLSHTEKSISEIAELAGYKDQTVFFRAFKQQTNLSPGIWRELHRFK